MIYFKTDYWREKQEPSFQTRCHKACGRHGRYAFHGPHSFLWQYPAIKRKPDCPGEPVAGGQGLATDQGETGQQDAQDALYRRLLFPTKRKDR